MLFLFIYLFFTDILTLIIYIIYFFYVIVRRHLSRRAKPASLPYRCTKNSNKHIFYLSGLSRTCLILPGWLWFYKTLVQNETLWLRLDQSRMLLLHCYSAVLSTQKVCRAPWQCSVGSQQQSDWKVSLSVHLTAWKHSSRVISREQAVLHTLHTDTHNRICKGLSLVSEWLS